MMLEVMCGNHRRKGRFVHGPVKSGIDPYSKLLVPSQIPALHQDLGHSAYTTSMTSEKQG